MEGLFNDVVTRLYVGSSSISPRVSFFPELREKMSSSRKFSRGAEEYRRRAEKKKMSIS
jgi:hypothetical protein